MAGKLRREYAAGAFDVVLMLFENNDELVATYPQNEIVLPEARGNALCGFRQQRIADAVTERIIDLLEIVEIEKSDTDPSVRLCRRCQYLRKSGIEETTVG